MYVGDENVKVIFVHDFSKTGDQYAPMPVRRKNDFFCSMLIFKTPFPLRSLKCYAFDKLE